MFTSAVVTAVGGVLGTEQFPTTAVGDQQLLAWMRGFGELARVGVEGTGTYGVSLARHLRAGQVPVVEVMRPNRQVRRRHGKTDVVDAIAAARAVLSGEANATPKTHDGPVEALRTLCGSHSDDHHVSRTPFDSAGRRDRGRRSDFQLWCAVLC